MTFSMLMTALMFATLAMLVWAVVADALGSRRRSALSLSRSEARRARGRDRQGAECRDAAGAPAFQMLPVPSQAQRRRSAPGRRHP
jgi:hypothetical protein